MNRIKFSDAIKETDIQHDMLDYLAYRGIEAWRNNTGAIYRRGRLIRFGEKGSGDIIGVLKDGRHIEVEVKTPEGELSDDQKRHAHRVQRNGGVYIVATCLEELHRKLKEIA